MKVIDIGMQLHHRLSNYQILRSNRFKIAAQSIATREISKLPNLIKNVVDNYRKEIDSSTFIDSSSPIKRIHSNPAVSCYSSNIINMKENHQICTKECRLKFRSLGKERITKLFYTGTDHTSLPKSTMWKLFSG